MPEIVCDRVYWRYNKSENTTILVSSTTSVVDILVLYYIIQESTIKANLDLGLTMEEQSVDLFGLSAKLEEAITIVSVELTQDRDSKYVFKTLADVDYELIYSIKL